MNKTGASRAQLLGAVLAGGRSSRFGSDKALALLDGRTLLDHAVARLADWCGTVVIAGREGGIRGATAVADWPAPGMGPLGGIAGALRAARAAGAEAVLTCGVDSPGLPDDLPERLFPGPAHVADQPVIGLWPVGILPALEAILAGSGRHSLRALAEATGARAVHLDHAPHNINRPADLDALLRRDPPG